MIMRDVNSGWLIRYTHANVASFFFIFVYAHIGRNLYYGSYKSPRVLPYSVGVIILILMMATAFLGYSNSPIWLNIIDLGAIPVCFSQQGNWSLTLFLPFIASSRLQEILSKHNLTLLRVGKI